MPLSMMTLSNNAKHFGILYKDTQHNNAQYIDIQNNVMP
jgi:hypothetical protein